MTNLMLIGAFSDRCGLSKRVLRHYDKLGLLVPNHIDEITGYRYYRDEQLAVAQRIQYLQGFGFLLKDILEILSTQFTQSDFIDVLKDREALLRNNIDLDVHHLLKLQQLIQVLEKESFDDMKQNVMEIAFEESPNSLRRAPMDSLELSRQQLKQLPNQSLFFEHIEELQSQLVNEKISFLTFDLDSFIHVNEQYGFTVGDQVIYTFFAIIRETFSDLLNSNSLNQICRLGGDEFSLFLVGVEDWIINEKINQCIGKVEAYDFDQVGCKSRMTASCGWTDSVGYEHPKSLRHYSTKAIMEAKRKGKNQGYRLTV